MKRFLIVLLLLLLVALAALKILVFELPKVAGNDMAPALQPGDLMLANRMSTTPKRGDLVLIEHPEVAARVLIRRVVGLPGERVTVNREIPAINGKRLSRTVAGEVELRDSGETLKMKLVEERLGSAPAWRVLKDPNRRSVDPRPVTLGTGQYYVMSDNRNHGTDSRTFGPIPEDKIRAVVSHRISAGPGSVTPQPKRDGWQRLR